MNYKIKTTTNALEFKPHNLDLIVGDKVTVTEVINGEISYVAYIQITAVLTQQEENRITQRKANHIYPYQTWLNMVTGYDADKKEPILNQTQLNEILLQFNLELDVSEEN
jgi:hypothetical protein